MSSPTSGTRAARRAAPPLDGRAPGRVQEPAPVPVARNGCGGSEAGDLFDAMSLPSAAPRRRTDRPAAPRALRRGVRAALHATLWPYGHAPHGGRSVKRTMAVILAGGEGARLSILSLERAKPAVPFGQVPDHRLHPVQLRQLGHRRGPRADAVQPPLAQRPHRSGRAWDLDRNTGACGSSSHTSRAARPGVYPARGRGAPEPSAT